MGIRNMALVGTHKDYLADVYDDRWGNNPSTVAECASAWDAAVSYFGSMFHNSGGLIRKHSIVVWPLDEGRTAAKIFDAWAEVTHCTEPDAAPDDYYIVIEAVERKS